MKKKFWTAAFMAVVWISSAFIVNAADYKTITFKGQAEKFVTEIGGSAQNGFSDMEPGESRDLQLTLKNDHTDEMQFYMSAEILDNIAVKADKNAVYDFEISKNEEIFFTAVIGGGNERNISQGEEQLTGDNNILLDTLKKGEENKIMITLTLDGDSAENLYMSQSGEIQFLFTVAAPDDSGTVVHQTVTKYLQGAGQKIIKRVKTGDNISVGIFAAAAISLLVIIAVIIKKRKEEE